MGLNEASPIIIEFDESSQIGDVEIIASITSNEDDYVQYQVSLPFSLSISEIQIAIGDITNDGAIDILDIVTIVNIILDVIDPNTYETIASDMNQDGIINVQDAILLVNLVLSD